MRLGQREIVSDETAIRKARGNRVAMIFQDAASALNPTFTIADQFREVLRRGDPKISNADAMRRAHGARRAASDRVCRGSHADSPPTSSARSFAASTG